MKLSHAPSFQGRVPTAVHHPLGTPGPTAQPGGLRAQPMLFACTTERKEGLGASQGTALLGAAAEWGWDPPRFQGKRGSHEPPPEGYQQILALLRWGTGKQPWCKQRAKGAATPSPPAVTPRGQGQAGKESVLQRGQEGMILVPPARPHSLGAALRRGLSPLQSRTPPRVLAGGSYCLRWSPGRLLPGVLHIKTLLHICLLHIRIDAALGACRGRRFCCTCGGAAAAP